jgi:hypothetical protein
VIVLTDLPWILTEANGNDSPVSVSIAFPTSVIWAAAERLMTARGRISSNLIGSLNMDIESIPSNGL